MVLVAALLTPMLLVGPSYAATTGSIPVAGVPGHVEREPKGLRRAADEEVTDPPLRVALSSITPSQIPRKGAITLSGVVTNASSDEWTDINIAPFISQQPITTRDELATQAATAADVAVGNRLTDPGTYVGIGDLAPRRSTTFTLRIPVSSLLTTGEPGVYWVGVHALGSNVDGRDLVADGRARTFMSLVPPAVAKRRTVPISVVLPLRERARRAADGSLNVPGRWAQLTSLTGRLTRLVDFGASAADAPVSWLVDPAVLDALGDFSAGNPPLSLGSQQGTDEESESGQPDASPSEVAPSELVPSAPTEEQQRLAALVLETFLATARSHGLLTLPYSDPDVVALARRRPKLLRRAEQLAGRRMSARDLVGRPAVAPPNGYFDPSLLPQVTKDALLVLSDRGRLAQPTISRLATGPDLLLYDARASAGGPAPTRSVDPLALRQRILAEAALEATKGAEAPLPVVVTFPMRWDPGPRWRAAEFFEGLETGWSTLAPLPPDPATTYPDELPYGSDQFAEEVGDANVSATRMLMQTSAVLADLLADTTSVTDRLTGAALQSSAYGARSSPRLAASLVLALDESARGQMEKVQVTGTDFVTLAGGSGTLTVTLVNGLKQPITVGLRARADAEVKIEAPEPVSMQPGQRTTLRLPVTSGVGVHDVTIYPVTAGGLETGTPLTFSLRTSQVGRLIWYIVTAGGTLLVVMIIRRIVLRVRSSRWRQDAEA